MSAFLVVLIIIAAGAIAIATSNALLGVPPLSTLGRRGRVWFDHLTDHHPEEWPDEDAVDMPIPRRPLRGRPD